MKALILPALAAAALSSPALAQQADWSGPYLGAYAGGAEQTDGDNQTFQFDTNLDGRFDNRVNTAAGANAFSPGFCEGQYVGATPAAGCTNKDDITAEFGVRAGYDWQWGSWVMGVVGEFGRTNVEDSVSAFSTTPAGYALTRRLTNLGAVRARAGYGFGRTLIYATGGYASGNIENRFATTNRVNTFTESSEGDRADGWQAGLGAEHRFTDKISVGLEYLYTSLDDQGYRVRASGPAPATNPFILTNPAGTDLRRSSDEFNIHAVRMTAAYRF